MYFNLTYIFASSKFACVAFTSRPLVIPGPSRQYSHCLMVPCDPGKEKENVMINIKIF